MGWSAAVTLQCGVEVCELRLRTAPAAICCAPSLTVLPQYCRAEQFNEAVLLVGPAAHLEMPSQLHQRCQLRPVCPPFLLSSPAISLRLSSSVIERGSVSHSRALLVSHHCQLLIPTRAADGEGIDAHAWLSHHAYSRQVSNWCSHRHLVPPLRLLDTSYTRRMLHSAALADEGGGEVSAMLCDAVSRARTSAHIASIPRV